MKFSSDKFNETRENYSFIGGKQKTTITFNKLIKKIKQDMTSDPKMDLAAQFDFYSVNCEDCQRERSKIVEMYLLSNDELKLAIAKGNEIDEDRPDLILRCPECFKEKRVIDMRKHIAIAGIEPLDEINGSGGMYNVSFGRNKDDPTNAFDPDIRDRLQELMNTKTMNKKAKQDLEKYVKSYAAIVKKIPEGLKKDYGSLLNTGSNLVKWKIYNLPRKQSDTVRVGTSINDAMEQAQGWVKEAIQKETKEQVAKLIKESVGILENVDIHDGRKLFVSRFTQREQDISNHYQTRSVTPLNNFYPYQPKNPFAGALDTNNNNPNKIQLENLMDNVQLSEGADAFFADGVMRSLVSKQIDFVLPDRTKVKVTIDPTWLENKAKLEPKFAAKYKEIEEPKIAEYLIRVSRLMEDLDFWDAEIKLLVTSTIFGRNALFIEKDFETEKDVYKNFGKPIGLVLLNPLNIKKAKIDDKTKKFDGFVYDWGVKDRQAEDIPRNRLIPFFYDDFNIYKNTYFSGMTRLFSLVGIAHSNQLINTYDLPEATKSQYTNTEFVYAGQPSQLLARKFARSVKSGINFHDQQGLRVDEAHAAKQIIDILETRDRNYQAMSMILGIPIFLLFGDSSNFATAAIAMQSYINGTCHRLGTFFMDAMEKNFFMPLLADISGITLEELIGKHVNRVKAIKPRVDLMTKTDRFNAANWMWDRQIITEREQYLKYVQEDEMAELAAPLDKLQKELKKAQKETEIERLEAEGKDPLNEGFAGGGNGKDTEKDNARMTPTQAGTKLLESFAGGQKKEGLKPSGGG